MKIKLLNQENFNYIRKYPNREHFSRWKMTASHNPEKQLKTDKLRILCLQLFPTTPQLITILQLFINSLI